jgi:hypothetical protein
MNNKTNTTITIARVVDLAFIENFSFSSTSAGGIHSHQRCAKDFSINMNGKIPLFPSNTRQFPDAEGGAQAGAGPQFGHEEKGDDFQENG